MRVFVAGAKNLEGQGAEAVIVDAFDAPAVESGSGNRRIDVAAEGAERYAEIRRGRQEVED